VPLTSCELLGSQNLKKGYLKLLLLPWRYIRPSSRTGWCQGVQLLSLVFCPNKVRKYLAKSTFDPNTFQHTVALSASLFLNLMRISQLYALATPFDHMTLASWIKCLSYAGSSKFIVIWPRKGSIFDG